MLLFFRQFLSFVLEILHGLIEAATIRNIKNVSKVILYFSRAVICGMKLLQLLNQFLARMIKQRVILSFEPRFTTSYFVIDW